MKTSDLFTLRDIAVRAASEAATFVQEMRKGVVEVEHKTGGSSLASQVVTEVDRKAEALILRHLESSIVTYGLGLLTEEQEDRGTRFFNEAFWCIDPLDGTLPYSESMPGYSVSIGLVAKNGTPLVGVVANPLTGDVYSAVRQNGMWLNDRPWKPLPVPDGILHIFTDRSFPNAPRYPRILAELEGIAQQLGCERLELHPPAGAVINVCRSLQREYGCYFKFPKLQPGCGSLWDYAASSCLAEEAGCPGRTFHGNPIPLNNRESTFMNREGVVFASCPSLQNRLLALLHPV